MQLLTTKRLILRNTKLEDSDFLYELVFKDEDVVRHTFGKEMFTKEQTIEFIKNNCNLDKEYGLSTLIEKQTNEIIGLAGVVKCEYLEQTDYEFGFILARKAWGKGYATEIGQAQIDFIRDVVKAPRVLALAAKENSGSANAIKKLGLEFVKDIHIPNRGAREVYLKSFY